MIMSATSTCTIALIIMTRDAMVAITMAGYDFGYDYDCGSRVFDHGGRYRDDFGHNKPHWPLKILFPSFNGESDPLTWLNKCDNYFCEHCVCKSNQALSGFW
jgi:hypothetical protein